MPDQFAKNRSSIIDSLPNQLKQSWNDSRETLKEIRHALEDCDSKLSFAKCQTLYVCGSLGRMERVASSDCDLVVVYDSSARLSGDQCEELMSDVYEAISQRDVEVPESDGIFSRAVTWSELTNDSGLGQVEEDIFVYGKRMQLLLDAQPVNSHSASHTNYESNFTKLQRRVLDRFYREEGAGAGCQWAGLLNEVLRYWKAIGVRSLWLDRQSVGRWRYINAKYRHSRNLMVFGFILLLGEASCRTDDSREWLLERLKWTPLERVWSFAADSSKEDLLESYNVFLSRMADLDFVERLKDEDNPERETPEFLELRQNAFRFVSAFTDILHDRCQKWPMEFRHELLL